MDKQQQRRHFSGADKVAILKRHLVEKVPISDLCGKRKIFLIVDRLTAHMAGVVTEWVKAHYDRIELFFMARREPERKEEE